MDVALKAAFSLQPSAWAADASTCCRDWTGGGIREAVASGGQGVGSKDSASWKLGEGGRFPSTGE